MTRRAARLETEAQTAAGSADRTTDWKAAHSDYVLTNDGSLDRLQAQVDALWPCCGMRRGTKRRRRTYLPR